MAPYSSSCAIPPFWESKFDFDTFTPSTLSLAHARTSDGLLANAFNLAAMVKTSVGKSVLIMSLDLDYGKQIVWSHFTFIFCCFYFFTF